MKRVTLLMCAWLLVLSAMAQTSTKLTKDQILAMSIEELSDLPLEDLMEAVETLGVTSVDELFAMIMNKNVSSASKNEEDAFKVPLSSSVITRSEIRTYGATTLEEALKLVPGVFLQQKTNGTYDVVMRGLNNIPDNQILVYTENTNVLVMVDGRPCHNYGIGGINLEYLPIGIEDIERIEAVRGANSALYGQDAVQGFINIITKKADDSESIISGSAQLGSMSTMIGDFAVRKSFNDKVAAGITMNLQSRDRFTDKVWTYGGGSYGLPDQYGQYYKLVDTDGDGIPDAPYLVDSDGDGVADFPVLSNPIQEGQWISVEDLAKAMQINPLNGQLVSQWDTSVPFSGRFKNPNLSRKTWGVNGYLTLKLAEDARIDMAGGYSDQHITTETLTEQYHSMSYRRYKDTYFNLNARIKGVHLDASYEYGPQNYYEGLPEFSVIFHHANAALDYDIKPVDFLTIRPGVAWQWVRYKDRDGGRADGGFFNDIGLLRKVAPSLRVDFNYGGFRAVAGIRSDKTNMPDKWNTSWQGALSYEINDKNFVRAVYSKSMRSAMMLATNSTYTWSRDVMPYRITFTGNEDADLMNIKTFEFGYRTRPSSRVLLDFEAFLSKSEDYSAMMAQETFVTLPKEVVAGIAASPASFTDPTALLQYLDCQSKIRNENLPYEVTQIGASMALDYIISSTLVARLNLNVQKTEIDNYYTYNQAQSIENQILGESGCLTRAITLATQLAMAAAQGPEYAMGQLGAAQQAGILSETSDGKYSVRSSEYEYPELQNGVESKATPKFYGALGLIYKPIKAIQAAATLNYLGERTYVTNFSTQKLNPHFTVDLKVGYKPISEIEVFFNARNLFDNEKIEFYSMDTIGGLYTFGVNFAF